MLVQGPAIAYRALASMATSLEFWATWDPFLDQLAIPICITARLCPTIFACAHRWSSSLTKTVRHFEHCAQTPSSL